MPKGGRRPGAGRPKGAKDRRVIERERVAKEAAVAGESPLQYMLRRMRDPNAEEADRDEMAKAAAPYVHARLQAIELDAGKPPDLHLHIDLLALARQVALALMLADQQMQPKLIKGNGST